MTYFKGKPFDEIAVAKPDIPLLSKIQCEEGVSSRLPNPAGVARISNSKIHHSLK